MAMVWLSHRDGGMITDRVAFRTKLRVAMLFDLSQADIAHRSLMVPLPPSPLACRRMCRRMHMCAHHVDSFAAEPHSGAGGMLAPS